MADDASVVLVHGAWHGAWCWVKVQRLLDEAGVTSIAVDLPLTSLEDDIAETNAAVAAVEGPVVLCGHSYGGAVVTGTETANVRHLVYLAAFAVDEGESPMNTASDAGVPATDLGSALVFSDNGTVVDLDRSTVAAFLLHDCDSADVANALKQLRPMRVDCLGTPSGPPAWRSTPSTYAVCANDRGVHPDLQRVMARRCTNTVEWPTAHSPFLNRPDLVAELLVALARS